MKKNRHVYAFIVLVLLVFFRVTWVLADEHGDDYESATPVEVGTVTNGNLGLPGDLDFFSFSVDAAAVYVMYTRGMTNTSGYLYKADYSQIAYDYGDGEEDNCF